VAERNSKFFSLHRLASISQVGYRETQNITSIG